MTPVNDVIDLYMIDPGDGYLWPDDEPMSSMDSIALLLEFNQCRRSSHLVIYVRDAAKGRMKCFVLKDSNIRPILTFLTATMA